MKIAIVNDLPMAVEALRRALAGNSGHQVVWTAADGAEAVARCKQETPDLLLMDLVMPGMDGVEATRRIMDETPCAILIVTSSVGANTWRVFDAMGHGALDAVDTPVLGGDPRTGAASLLAKIDAIGRLIGGGRPVAMPAVRRQSVGIERLVAIGASAGGPAALSALLSALPGDFPAAVVIVQHVDRQFAVGMAEWLRQHSRLPVQVAEEGDRPQPGRVLLAGTNDHLAFTSAHRLGYTREPVDCVYRPSVDAFFHSVCRFWPGETIGVLLTGMGRDGALGLKALRDRGWHTIAQDRTTSAVYGMPKAAADVSAAVEILALDRIARRLVERFGRVPQGGARTVAMPPTE
ncbi:chemotaxis response regulator protein-glutamate methylesterase [Azoarcus sp. KH32C]|uniref:chemotaxis response regulator protein-glutamate methylesterase n=1 Tax=Azoarcus sp. KH32C TaxID=748247 RepID=UPI0002385B94|nr:chemotaxis response regulator protein-glutamate methylesterase [Azoarcus sp. KH32C]BAL27271.1 chemotaxis-specific methylesterase [Azoarcus sp. KH32C]